MTKSAHRRRAPASASWSRLGRRALWIAGVLGLLAALIVGGRWYARTRALDGSIERGLALLENAATLGEVEAALSRWVEETEPCWGARAEQLVARLFTRHSLEDARIRALLTRASGADYGDRLDDWERWRKARKRAREGLPPLVGPGRAVKLEPLWTAPIGLTAWFSSIIPLDGQIYVASLGAAFNDPRDSADGVVRVDGKTGHAELIFQPTGAAARDVLGIAAGDDGLFVACRNGTLYCISPDGELRWEIRVGAAIVSPPMSIDINDNGVSDVLIVTGDDQVVAISGSTGQTAWVRKFQPPRGGSGVEELVRATLAAGKVFSSRAADVIVTTASGRILVMSATDGSVRWESGNDAGVFAGAVTLDASADVGPPAYFGDRVGRVWSLTRSGGGLEAVPAWKLSPRESTSIIAALRLVRPGEGLANWLIACPAGSSERGNGSVCALTPSGLRWCYAPGGIIWGAPAVADLNGDGQSEIIVPSILRNRQDAAAGLLTVLSWDGHALRRIEFDAPLECSPVVADVDGDGTLELLVADQGGTLHCYKTRGFGPIEWGLLGGDSHNTRNAANAYQFGQAPAGFQWGWRPGF